MIFEKDYVNPSDAIGCGLRFQLITEELTKYLLYFKAFTTEVATFEFLLRNSSGRTQLVDHATVSFPAEQEDREQATNDL